MSTFDLLTSCSAAQAADPETTHWLPCPLLAGLVTRPDPWQPADEPAAEDAGDEASEDPELAKQLAETDAMIASLMTSMNQAMLAAGVDLQAMQSAEPSAPPAAPPAPPERRIGELPLELSHGLDAPALTACAHALDALLADQEGMYRMALAALRAGARLPAGGRCARRGRLPGDRPPAPHRGRAGGGR